MLVIFAVGVEPAAQQAVHNRGLVEVDVVTGAVHRRVRHAWIVLQELQLVLPAHQMVLPPGHQQVPPVVRAEARRVEGRQQRLVAREHLALRRHALAARPDERCDEGRAEDLRAALGDDMPGELAP
jgi:hypothetical protein